MRTSTNAQLIDPAILDPREKTPQMMRRLLLLLCCCVVVHAFTGPSNSRSILLLSRSSRTAVIVGESTASHQQTQPSQRRTSTSLSIGSNDEESIHQQQPNPKTFREGEVLGLRLMQSGKHDEALKGELNC